MDERRCIIRVIDQPMLQRMYQDGEDDPSEGITYPTLS